MMDKAPEPREIVLRDLESLLRKKLSDELKLVSFTSESLLPSGENYGSSIFKVRATVKISVRDEAKEEVLELVAKMLPPTDFQRMIFDSPYTFRKEAFLYEELIPSYQRLEREFGIKSDEVFDIVPPFYGARYSLKSEEDFDEDAVILMQNLKVLGYYTGERREGLDFEHAKTAITSLARFHALGMAMKCHKPEYFEVLKFRSKCLAYPSDTSGFEDITNTIQRLISEDPELSVFSGATKGAMSQKSAMDWTALPTEPWSTIIHSDFWVNNIMFHKDPKSNRVDDVKFVDFQNYLFLSPLRELTFFLIASTNADVMKNQFDELLDIYYEKFIEVLKRIKCDTEPFARDKFDERMKIDAYEEFPHCPFMLKMMCADIKADEKFDSVEKFKDAGSGNERFMSRLRRSVKKFNEKGWLVKPKHHDS
ncbi:uncharacterized protein LOC100116429 [Nasonia vitripennis]|uniref:CHK kinase-like domain-containing protein n=1 Tax=Nasonia vitripennis TaxID=7425 RepID=A0A7M7G2Y7_NASVI|nr:uncharacterized protein LOC100116429 [Nasonia vitripennis]